MSRLPLDITGRTFGRLTAVRAVGQTTNGKKWRVQTWLCLCTCGRTRTVSSSSLTSGKVTHCDRRRGVPRGITYTSYVALKARCYQTGNKEYANYGGRGILVCDRWLTGDKCSTGFECFLADMGERPSSKHSIDRRDSNGHYEPANCQWSTSLDQVRNRRNTRFVKYDGVRMPLAQAAKLAGIPYGTVLARIAEYGMSDERALSPESLRGKYERRNSNVQPIPSRLKWI